MVGVNTHNITPKQLKQVADKEQRHDQETETEGVGVFFFFGGGGGGVAHARRLRHTRSHGQRTLRTVHIFA